MPQMYPMMWLFMYIMTMTIYSMFLIMIFFTPKFNNHSPNKTLSSSNHNYKITIKW